MNCIIDPFINDIDLAICIFPADTITNDKLAEKMMHFTSFYAMRLNQMCQENDSKIDIYFAESIDSGLSELHRKHKNILFMAAGVRIFDQSIIFDIKNEILNNPDYFVAGHILEWKEDWYEIHHQFVLVNTSIWAELKKPIFGGWESAVDELPVIERSIENFHNDYTPIWIKHTGEIRPQKHNKQGWNFIRISLINNKKILNWSTDIRKKRTYYYPESNGDNFLSSLSTWEIEKDANVNQRMLINGLKSISEQIWVLNTELLDIEIWNEKFKTMAFPAAGFKFLDVFMKDILHDNGKIIIYDFNQKSLDWIKTIYESQSIDIESLFKDFEHKKHFIFGDGPMFGSDGQFTSNFVKYYKTTLDYFGGRGNFLECIKKFRNTTVEFIHCDLIKDPKTLISRFDKETLLNISNIYCTDFSNTVWGIEKTHEHLVILINLIKGPTVIIGQDAYCKLIKKRLNYEN